MAVAPEPPVVKHRFLLELWLEPRQVATRIRRIRGRIQDLTTRRTSSVGGLRDVDEFIQSTVAGDDSRDDIDWETGS